MTGVILLITMFLSSSSLLSQSACLTGEVATNTRGPLINATVVLYKNNLIVTVEDTDIYGSYVIDNLNPGTYRVEFCFLGYQDVIKHVLIKGNETAVLCAQFVEEYIDSNIIQTNCFNSPSLFDLQNFNSGTTFTPQFGFLKQRI